MTKFAMKPVPRSKGPVKTQTQPSTITHVGGAGYEREDAKSELFLLAVTNMVGEETFYESGASRDARYADLVHAVTRQDPDWMQRFLPWLRTEGLMRSASVQGVAEYVRAGGPNARKLVADTLQRADEPGELLAYFRNQGYRTIPKPVKRGVADVLTRLYTQNAALKYDGQDRPWNFGDVIELIRPKPVDGNQSLWFKYLVDRAHNPQAEIPPVFLKVSAARKLNTDENATAEDAGKAGLDWTMASGKGEMNAAAWEAQIPSMGYMAMLRNLRNFSEAGISAAAVDKVNKRLADPDEVRRSKQFPYRFISAYLELAGLTYASALDRAIDLSLDNVPVLSGDTLVMLDCSSSMQYPVSIGSKMTYVLAGLTFAVGFQKKNPGSKVFGYGREPFLELTTDQKDPSVLKMAQELVGLLRGESTYPWQSIERVWTGQERIIIITDEQSYDSPSAFSGFDKTRIFIWNLEGYTAGTAGGKNVVTLGGFTDKIWTMVELIDRGQRADWPF
jgi:hypothetical protein